MKIAAMLCAFAGGILYLLGGVFFEIPQETITKITSFYSNDTFVKVLYGIKYMTALGGITIVAGGIVGYTASKKVGKILVIIGCAGGLPDLFSTIWSSYQAGVFSAPDFDTLEFFMRQGMKFMGTAISFAAFLLFR